MIRVTIPSYRKVEDPHDSYTVFNVEVYSCGRIMCIEKRYSAFEDLHKQLKKIGQTPEFPPKKVMKWNPKVLEQRRAGLQTYLQVFTQTENLPKPLLRFLGVTLPKSESIESLSQEDQELCLSHQPMIGFPSDAFLQDNFKSNLNDIIAEGVHQGLYSNSLDDLIR